MKNTYIVIGVLAVLLGGALIFGMQKNAEAPTSPMPQVPGTQAVSTSTTVTTTTVTTPAVKEFTISGKNFSFTPSLITVNKGDRVKITFVNSSGFHDFKIDEYGIAAPQKQSPSTSVLEFTADKAGSFEYYCSVGSHRAQGMKGTLIVK